MQANLLIFHLTILLTCTAIAMDIIVANMALAQSRGVVVLHGGTKCIYMHLQV
jgi:hypothetical protein